MTAAMLSFLLFSSLAFLALGNSVSIDKGNETMPHVDYHLPNCQRLITWERVFDTAAIGVRETQCQSLVPGSQVLPMTWVFSLLQIIKERTKYEGDMVFFVQTNNGRYCSLAKVKINRPFHFGADLEGISEQNAIACNFNQMKRTNFIVCGRVLCPPEPITQPPPTTTIQPTTRPTSAVTVLKSGGLFGLPIDDEVLFYRILIAVLLFLVLLLVLLLIQACLRIGRMRRKLSRECMSNVTIRRVTADDQYSSMAAIGETGSLGGAEFYGSIARRKELNRERKMWLRERSCGGSTGIPASPDDLNGLIPTHHGSLSGAAPHRTSISSLTQGQGHNGSLRRLASYGPPRPPMGPQQVCHLSRQNTTDSLPSKSAPPPMPPLPPMPPMPPMQHQSNGHMQPQEEEAQGHMV